MLPRLPALLLVSIFLLSLICPARAEEFTGKVVGIDDGDSFKVLTPEKQEIRVRLLGIDAPEWKQPFREVAKKALSDLIYNRVVLIVPADEDRYHRVLANVYVDRIWVNLAQVRAGLAWHYARYSSDKTLATAEADARAGRLGLWQEPNPRPPWNWRAAGRKKP